MKERNDREKTLKKPLESCRKNKKITEMNRRKKQKSCEMRLWCNEEDLDIHGDDGEYNAFSTSISRGLPV